MKEIYELSDFRECVARLVELEDFVAAGTPVCVCVSVCVCVCLDISV